MKHIFRVTIMLLLFGSICIVNSCKKENASSKNFGPFSFQDNNTAIMNGEIGSNTPEQWDSYIADYPNTNRIIMKDCPGSSDDNANLNVARKIRDQGVDIHLPTDAIIASGAVDLFLAGTKRTRENGSKIGVHSWSDGQNDATSFPVGHAYHQPYIEYYKEMGFSQSDADAFYYFTINAASASNIHWMTDEEIEIYKLITPE